MKQMNVNNHKYEERKQWFIDRIGKRVFRTKTSCDCESCKNVYENGTVIEDRDHAVYLFAVEGEKITERYFDTKEEVEEYENNKTGSGLKV